MTRKEYLLVLLAVVLMCIGAWHNVARAQEAPECTIPRAVDIVCRQVRTGKVLIVQCVDRRGTYFEFVRSEGVS